MPSVSDQYLGRKRESVYLRYLGHSISVFVTNILSQHLWTRSMWPQVCNLIAVLMALCVIENYLALLNVAGN